MELLVEVGRLKDSSGKSLLSGPTYGKPAAVIRRLLVQHGEEPVERVIRTGMRCLFPWSQDHRPPFTAFDVERKFVDALAASYGQAPGPRSNGSGPARPQATEMAPPKPYAEQKKQQEAAQARYDEWLKRTAELFKTTLTKAEKAEFADRALTTLKVTPFWDTIDQTRRQGMINRSALTIFALEHGHEPPPER